jgi:hypothetical protein
VLGVVPLEVTDDLLEVFRRLADHHERGRLLVAAGWPGCWPGT